jgi:hypothetical protein
MYIICVVLFTCGEYPSIDAFIFYWDVLPLGRPMAKIPSDAPPAHTLFQQAARSIHQSTKTERKIA